MAQQIAKTPGLPKPLGTDPKSQAHFASALTQALYKNLSDAAARANSVLPKDGTESMSAPLPLYVLTAAALPAAADWPGGEVFISDEGVVAVSDGSSWLRPLDMLAAGSILYSKIQDVSAADKVLGRASAGAGVIEEIPCTAIARTFLAYATAAAEFNGIKQAATTTATGVVEKSTSAENIAGTATDKFPDVAGVKEMLGVHGTVVDRAYAEYTAWGGMSAAIPSDDTIPQITEGTELLSVTITPKSVTNRLRVHVSMQGASNASAVNVAAALFQDTDADAIHTFWGRNPANGNMETVLAGVWEYVPGTTAEITLSVRVGPNTGFFYVNGNTTGRQYGGTMAATLVVEEIVP